MKETFAVNRPRILSRDNMKLEKMCEMSLEKLEKCVLWRNVAKAPLIVRRKSM